MRNAKIPNRKSLRVGPAVTTATGALETFAGPGPLTSQGLSARQPAGDSNAVDRILPDNASRHRPAIAAGKVGSWEPAQITQIEASVMWGSLLATTCRVA
jgi:hypothetical protein